MPKRQVIIAAWLACLFLGLYGLVTHTRVVTDLTAFLPQAASQQQQILISQLQQGPAARLVLVALDGAAPDALASASNALARRLVSDEHFDFVANGSVELEARDYSWLFRHRYLLSRAVTAERFAGGGLRHVLDRTRERLRTSSGDLIKPLVARDPTGEFLEVLAATDYRGGPGSRHGVWFDRSGTRALLLLETRAPALAIEAQEAVRQSIERAFTASARPGVRITLAGPAMYAIESRKLIERESLTFTLIAVSCIVTLLAWVYRNLGLMLLVFVPAASGIVAAVVLVSVSKGAIHGITLAFAVTLLGEAVDYPSYLLLQARPGLPLSAAAREIWPTLRLAVLTTLAGGVAMLFSSIQGLMQLGLLGAIGVTVAGLVNRWVVPAIAPHQRPVLPQYWKAPTWLRRVLRPRRGLVGALAFMAAASLTITHFGWQDDLGALNPLPNSLKQRDQELRNEFGAPDVRLLIAYPASDVEHALRGSERLRPALDALVQSKVIAGYEMAADFLPSQETQRARLAALPNSARLQIELREAAKAAGFRVEALAPFLDEIEQARRLAPISLDDISDRPWRLRADALLAYGSEGVSALVALRGVADAQALAARMPELAPALLIDLKKDAGELVASYRQQVLVYTSAGLLLITLLLVSHLRSAASTLLVIIPPVLAVLCTVAALSALGEKLTLFHLVALLLVLGIGINYALFFNRPSSDRVFFSLLVCCATTLIGFGSIAFSSIPVLHGIGLTSVIGAGLSFLFSAWFSQARADQSAAE